MTSPCTATGATRVRVRYAETDQMGVVYYANYFVWFEVGPHGAAADARLVAIARWKHAGFSLPVIEAHCHYLRPARYDDELEIRTAGALVSPVRLAFDYEVVREGDERIVTATGTRCTRRVDAAGAAVRLPRAREGAASHEGARHRRRRLHRLAPGRHAARPRRRGHRPRLLHRLLPAADQGSQPRHRWRGRPGFRFVETTIQDADLARCSTA